MTYRLLLAHDDVLTSPLTVRRVSSGDLGGSSAPADLWLTNDLGVATYFAPGTTTVRFSFRRRVTIGVVALMNFRLALADPVTSTFMGSASATVTLFDGATNVASATFTAPLRPESPLDLDQFLVPSAPVISDALVVSVSAPTVGFAPAIGVLIGRVFAAPALAFDGNDQGGLDSGWRLSATDQIPAQIGVTGAARPQPAVTGRRVSFTVSGVPDAGALYATQASRFGLPTMETVDALADLQARVGSSRPILAMLRPGSADAAVRRRYAAFGLLSEPFSIARPAGGSVWSASFTVNETQR